MSARAATLGAELDAHRAELTDDDIEVIARILARGLARADERDAAAERDAIARAGLVRVGAGRAAR